MGKRVNQFVVEPFINELGQTINPGDFVSFITTSRCRVRMRKAWFDGVFKDKNGKVVLTRIRGINNTKSVETGKILTYEYDSWDWNTHSYIKKPYQYNERIKVPCDPYGYSILQCNRIIKIHD